MIMFFSQAVRHLFQVGTFFPSSPWLARSMAGAVISSSSPKRVLEIGPGTGSITRAILSTLRDGDEFHLVEINPRFCRHIESRILRPYRPEHPKVRIDLICDSILSAELRGGYDFVICSLPFRAFPPDAVRRICNRLRELVGEQGVLTYMEYPWVMAVQSPFLRPARRRELKRIDHICHRLNDRFEVSRDFVLVNAPPTMVIQLALPVHEIQPAPAPRREQVLIPELLAAGSHASVHP